MTVNKFAGRLKKMIWPGRRMRGSILPFDLLFGHFKEVLEKNNRALEIITDIGDKLGGDYLFDISYVKKAYSELSTALGDSLVNFDLLTQEKYPHLHEAVDRIEGRIRKMIFDISSPGEMVVFYDNISWDNSHTVGGKNANLAEVRNYLRLEVPAAFVLTTAAFDVFMRHNHLDRKIETLTDKEITNPALMELHDAILGAEIPPQLGNAIEKALEEMKTGCSKNCFLAVRSSAEEEDTDFSFAGQFETRLNVPPERSAVIEAYREVLASLFSPRAVSYQRHLGYSLGKIKMAVGCMAMVDAESSGVACSTNPSGDKNTMIINAAWGLGVTVVEGRTDTDLYLLRKDTDPEIIYATQGSKEFMAIADRESGVETVRTPEGMSARKSLTEEQARELARQAVLIERHFRKPQEIEWAIDTNGKVYILQTRPLRIDETASGSSLPLLDAAKREYQKVESLGDPFPTVLLRDKGVVVQRGVGGGRVFIVRHPEELDRFPKGAVLVATHDSSDYVRVMPYVSAIITDRGAPSSHMASLCREFKVPTVVNTGDATRVVLDGQDITVYAEEGNIRIYRGIRSDLLDQYRSHSRKMEDLIEFRKKRYLLRYISPLNLVNPLLDNFDPEGCRTIHDIIRFIHEKSVSELVERSLHRGVGARNQDAARLDIPVPAGIVVVDIGGALSDHKINSVTLDGITSFPLRAIIRGMIHPGVWKSTIVSLKVNDFLSSMMRMPDIVTDAGAHAPYNLAVASREYANLNLRFGYHFTVVDSFCSETARNNHIYFRFAGGATDIAKRSRRVGLISIVLKEYGFSVSTKGDLLIARIANMRKEEMEVILDQLGRLIAYTRQLDAELHDDRTAERYARDFLEGRYCH